MVFWERKFPGLTIPVSLLGLEYGKYKLFYRGKMCNSKTYHFSQNYLFIVIVSSVSLQGPTVLNKV